MRVSGCLRALARRAWIVPLVAIIAVVTTLAVGQLRPRVYRSTVFLNVWPARLDFGLQQTIKGLMRNYAGTIRSRENALRVVNDLELDITPEQFIAKLRVEPIESDYRIRIDADDYDPTIARDIAQRAGEVFVEQTKVDMVEQEMRDRVEVSLLDDALPGRLVDPNWTIDLLASGLFGLFAGAAAVFVLERLDAASIRTRQDAEAQTGVAVLGVIPLVALEGRQSAAPCGDPLLDSM